MTKNIIKEIIIALLLCLAILLILAVLLYSYIPNNKVIPELVAYSIPEDAKEVINEATEDTSKIIMSYEINSSDISTAQKTNVYNPGKVDPFSSYEKEKEVEGTTGGTTSNSTTSTTGTSNGTTTGTTETSTINDNSSEEGTVNGSTKGGTGTYYQNKGTK